MTLLEKRDENLVINGTLGTLILEKKKQKNQIKMVIFIFPINQIKKIIYLQTKFLTKLKKSQKKRKIFNLTLIIVL